jgi:hypothetical protein
VEKYAAVSAFLAEKFGEDSDTAWRRIQRAVPGAKVYSELVGGELPTEETPRRVERRKRSRDMGGLLNSYLGKLNAIAAFQPEFEPEVGQRRSAGEHKTVYGAGRVAFNPRNPSEGERHISYEEQERRRKLYAPSREKAAERRRLRAALAILAEADLEAARVSEARKKGARARPPKPVYTKEYLASKGMKRNGRVNETIAYILGLDIYNAGHRHRLISFKESLQNDPVLRDLFHKAVSYVLATTPSSKIEATLRSRRGEYQSYVRPLDALTKLSNEADEKGWVDRAAVRKKKSAFAETAPAAAAPAAAAPAAEKKPPSAPKKKRPPAPSKAAAFIKSAFAVKRNPLEAYRQTAPDGTTFQRVYVGRDATLDIEFSQTDWSHPGAPKTVRILPSSRGHLGTLVRNLTNHWSTADEVLTAAVAAEASADDMFNAYPQYEFRSAARYYEALTEVLTDLAASLQRGWR